MVLLSLQDTAGITALCILGMAIRAPLLLAAARGTDDSAHTSRKARTASAPGTAGSVLRCSLSHADGAASLTTMGDSVPSLSKPHASCHIAALRAATNRRQQTPSTTPAPQPSPALQQPLSMKHIKMGATAVEHDVSPALRMHSQQQRRSASKLRGPPAVAAVTGTGRDRLGFLTDPAELDACLQLGVVDPMAECQVPVAVDAAPVPLGEHHATANRRAASRHSAFAVFAGQAPGPPPQLTAAGSRPHKAERTATATMHSPDSSATTAALQGLRTKPVGSASRVIQLAATDLPEAAAAPVKASSSIYRVAWEVMAAAPQSMPALPSILRQPSQHIALRTDSSSITLQGHHANGASALYATKIGT